MSDGQKKYEFKRKLEELREKTGRGTELVTIYIPPDKQISNVVAQLRDEHGQAANIKSKSTRVNVQSALDSIMARLKYFKNPPENGMVIFCGMISIGGDRTTMETIVIELPEPITTYMYRCGSEFVLGPLEDMLKEKKTFGLVALDRREATIGLLKGRHIELIKHMTSNVPGKQKRGGQSAKRFQQLRLIAINEFYKRIGDSASKIFLEVDHKDLQGILIGGPSPTKEEFIGGEYLHHELQPKIQGVFDISYTDESGLYELVDAAMDTLQNLDLMQEKKLVNRFMRELVSDRNLATYGEDNVRKNLKMGAVDTLLLSEDLRRIRIYVKCTSCDYQYEKTVQKPDKLEACPRCDKALELVEITDIVTELSEMGERINSTTVFISTDFEEGEQLMNAFGGIAAILRFQTGV
ncbi:MAG: peptide chain release factor aRF-1 [Methanosarcinales archaeon Met12]|nr:MAG: peptide chain release factor aRF-1 [Methanosarcinales archaeon Met12]